MTRTSNRQDIIVGVDAKGRRWIGQGAVDIPKELVDYERIYNRQIRHRAVKEHAGNWRICLPTSDGAERPFSGNGPGGGRGYWLDPEA